MSEPRRVVSPSTGVSEGMTPQTRACSASTIQDPTHSSANSKSGAARDRSAAFTWGARRTGVVRCPVRDRRAFVKCARVIRVLRDLCCGEKRSTHESPNPLLHGLRLRTARGGSRRAHQGRAGPRRRDQEGRDRPVRRDRRRQGDRAAQDGPDEQAVGQRLARPDRGRERAARGSTIIRTAGK